MILDGQFAPGDTLSERYLAERFALGRMPIREALRELAKDGLVESVPGRGTSVRRLSLEDLQDIYEARQAIDGMAAYLAARRGPPPELAAFRERFVSLLEASSFDAPEAQRAGAEFHVAIIEASQNRELARMLKGLQAKISLVLNMRKNPERAPVSLREHLSILEAIESGEAEEAQRRMWNHLAKSFEARIQLHQKVA
ncbi:GntR family transcriptional regulator [Microvirga arabica]|nr:GntR family transcriptional regulator [Microvirga arabica]